MCSENVTPEKLSVMMSEARRALFNRESVIEIFVNSLILGDESTSSAATAAAKGMGGAAGMWKDKAGLGGDANDGKNNGMVADGSKGFAEDKPDVARQKAKRKGSGPAMTAAATAVVAVVSPKESSTLVGAVSLSWGYGPCHWLCVPALKLL